jgi:predicted outer membrane protein
VSDIACNTDFDAAYTKAMYQQHADISAVATMGIEQTQDKNLRDLAIKIRNERAQQNEKLAMFNRQLGLGTLPLDYNEMAMYRSQLSDTTGRDFDIRFATVMMGLLQQSRNAATMAQSRAALPALRNQAGIVAKSDTNEIDALQRWLNRNNLPVPPDITGGAGPGGTAPCPPGTTAPPAVETPAPPPVETPAPPAGTAPSPPGTTAPDTGTGTGSGTGTGAGTGTGGSY